jgi:hypothetical protein
MIDNDNDDNGGGGGDEDDDDDCPLVNALYIMLDRYTFCKSWVVDNGIFNR